MSAPAALKRTRRLENPFDDRLEVRMYSTEKAKLFAEAEKRGMTAGDLVRQQLGDLIDAEPPEAPERPVAAEPTETPSEIPVAAPEPSHGATEVDLAEAISAVTGTSWGYASLQIKLGKVTLAGEPWTDRYVPADRLADVELRGEPLPIEPIEQNAT